MVFGNCPRPEANTYLPLAGFRFRSEDTAVLRTKSDYLQIAITISASTLYAPSAAVIWFLNKGGGRQ
jgi:hypothetical protein